MIQLKVQLTEPTPITSGRATVEAGEGPRGPLGDIQDVVLFAPGGDVSGAAVVNGHQASIRFFSQHGTFGTGEDTPIIAVSIPVLSNATRRQNACLNLDPSRSFWVAPSGQTYEQETASGVFTVGGSVSISNVVPGGRWVPAGSTVTVSGTGFQHRARVEIDDVETASTEYLGPTRLDVVLARSTEMHGKRVRVTNRDHSSAVYYSYLRATPLGESTRPLLAATVPIFRTGTFSQAFFIPVVDRQLFMGLALQNPSSTQSLITIDLFSPQHQLIGSSSFTLPSETRISRTISEYLPDFNPSPGNYLRVSSSVPVQMVGLVGDEAEGSVVPVDPILFAE